MLRIGICDDVYDAQRCGGTLQAGAGQGRFCLLVSLPSVQN